MAEEKREVNMVAQADTPAYSVRVYSGSRSQQEREAAVREAAEQYFRSIRQELEEDCVQPKRASGFSMTMGS